MTFGRRPDVRGEDGFTLPEMLVAIAILAIIAAPMSIALMTGLRVVGKTDQKFTDSRGALVSAADWAGDVANANVITTTNTPAPCGAALNKNQTLVVTFAWNDATNDDLSQTKTYTNEASYVYDASDPTNNKLIRRLCKSGGSAVQSDVAMVLNGTPTVQCFVAGAPGTAVACSTAKVNYAKLTVTLAPNSKTPDTPNPTPFTFTLDGTRRTT